MTKLIAILQELVGSKLKKEKIEILEKKGLATIIACSKDTTFTTQPSNQSIVVNSCYFGFKSGWLQMDFTNLEAFFFWSHPTSINFYVFSKTY
jgi:hypothetical protein